MSIEHDPWGATATATAAPQQKTTAENGEMSTYAPFSVFSCKKAFAARALPRKKLHLLIYCALLVLYIGMISLELLVTIKASEILTRSYLITLAAELVIVWGIGATVLSSRRSRQFRGWSHTLHLFITVIYRAYFWAISILLLSLAIENYLESKGRIFWLQDDLNLLNGILVVYLLWSGARYFRKEG